MGSVPGAGEVIRFITSRSMEDLTLAFKSKQITASVDFLSFTYAHNFPVEKISRYLAELEVILSKLAPLQQQSGKLVTYIRPMTQIEIEAGQQVTGPGHEGGGGHGLYDGKSIAVNVSMDPENMIANVVHEMLHGLRPDDDEVSIDALTQSLLQRTILSSRRIAYIHRPYAGFTVFIENPAGTFRYGVDSDGHEWRTQMIYDYGFLPATEGADGEGVDVYLGPNEEAEKAFVIHQQDPDTKEYDEDKVMLGFDTPGDAEAAYRVHYDKDGFFQSMDEFAMSDFASTVQQYQKKKKRATGRVAAELPILVTAFGPFGEFEHNSSWEAVKSLRGFKDVIVERFELRSILPQMEEIIDQHKPRAVFSFGQGHALRIETLAQNPGVDGPKEYQASADVKAYVDALSAMGYPIGLSSEAGGWFSEETLYALEHLRATKYEDLDVLFVHLPPFDGVEVTDLKQFVGDLLMIGSASPEKAADDDRPFTVAVDFDGTLAQDYEGEFDPNQAPAPRDGAVEKMKEFKKKGWRIIINTVRGNEALIKRWMEEYDCPYDHINENPDQPEDASDKVMADVYIDDKAVSADVESWDDIADEVMEKAVKEACRMRRGIAHWRANNEYIEYEIPNDRIKPQSLILALRQKNFDAFYPQESPKRIMVKVPKGDDSDKVKKEVQEILNIVMMGAKVPLREYGKGISTDAVKTDTVSSQEPWLGEDQSSAEPRHESEIPMGQFKNDDRPGMPRPGSAGLPSRRAMKRRVGIASRVADLITLDDIKGAWDESMNERVD